LHIDNLSTVSIITLFLHQVIGIMPKILVVDDDSAVRDLICTLLELEGHELLQAQSGHIALQIIQEDTPDLVVLDYMMPGLDGIELSRRIRAIPDCATLPILLITAFDKGFRRISPSALGIDAFFMKPLNPDLFLSHIRTVLNVGHTNLV
jgi:DNA-binding response OmpR family regulator